MDKYLLEEVIACLPRERTRYYYFKDRYALMLLSNQVGEGMTVAELKKSRLNSLLQKPQVKKFLSAVSNGYVDATSLDSYWPDDYQPFVLTVGRWGGKDISWQQTTRKGYNLVVQLNFSNAHDSLYRSLVKPARGAVLNYWGHPVFKPKSGKTFRETLAWARLDIDFDTDEVLIEEIQSDWVREARDLLQDAQACCDKGENFLDWINVQGKAENIVKYVKQVLMPYLKIWDEAVLAATLSFVRNELGISRVYYHSYESGPELKCINGSTPRYLYTALPKRFCFDKTGESPVFLQKDRRFKRMLRKISAPQWYRMDLREGNSNACIS